MSTNSIFPFFAQGGKHQRGFPSLSLRIRARLGKCGVQVLHPTFLPLLKQKGRRKAARNLGVKEKTVLNACKPLQKRNSTAEHCLLIFTRPPCEGMRSLKLCSQQQGFLRSVGRYLSVPLDSARYLPVNCKMRPARARPHTSSHSLWYPFGPQPLSAPSFQQAKESHPHPHPGPFWPVGPRPANHCFT